MRPWIKPVYQAWLLACMLVATPLMAQERIVTIDAAVTEIVFALGAGEQVVGRDTTSTYPLSVQALPDVGYMRQLTVEGILSLNPTVVIASSDAKPSKTLDRLAESGVRVVVVENESTLAGIERKIHDIAQALQLAPRAQALIDKMTLDFNQAQAQIQQQQAAMQRPLSALFVLSVRNGNLSVAGQGSRANALLQLLGVHNPVEKQIHNYQPLSAEAAINVDPDVILMIEQGVSMSGGEQAVLANPVLQSTRAMKGHRLLIMPNEALVFGPRIGEVMRDVAERLKHVQSGVVRSSLD